MTHATPSPPALKRHLLDLSGLSRSDLDHIFDLAQALRDADPLRDASSLCGTAVALLFYESSTRTRVSFELAATRLGAHTVNLDLDTSSARKGESIRDTALTLEAMGVRILVVRHGSTGLHGWLAPALQRAALVNAGDGAGNHPTQGLLDCLTIRDEFGAIDGLRIAVMGDILHSRVARSQITALKTLGAKVTLCGPSSMVPEQLAEAYGATIVRRPEDALRNADVISLLRIQLERQSQPLFPSLAEYRRLYGLSARRLAYAPPHAIVLHPGPANRGVEIDDEVLGDPRCKVSKQVGNGVAVRMAILSTLAGGERHV